MKLSLALYCLLSLTFTVVEVNGALRGETSQKHGRMLDSKDEKDNSPDLEETATETPVNECRDVPVRVRDDGSQTNFATLYAGVYAWGDATKVEDKKLCETFKAAYKHLTDCSLVPGAYREVAKCDVIPDAVGPNDESFLLKLTYFANTVNGAMLFHFDEPDPTCSCDRCPGLEPFPGIFREGESGPVCTCYCDIFSEDLTNTACTCRSPIISSLVEVMNVAYKHDEFYFLDARQLTIDSECTNTGVTSLFNDTFVCPGEQDPSFFQLWTDFPSASPTESPTV